MKIARRALVAALITLILCVAVSAQTLRSDTDPRNIAPAVGTGGPVGGPTGLFTIYDGQTLRRGEFTIDLSYSNYDRDPGNVDITKITSSFQVGLNDYVELFFNTDHYTGIKVNNPNNLSGFYLPNIGFQSGSPLLPSGSSAAIVLAPIDNAGNTNGAVFRPAFNQPFVGFPFVGSSAGTFGQGAGGIRNGRGTLFGFPGFAATLGAVAGGGGRFGAASQFPGIGSPVGGILPGIVLATNTAPATAITGPITFPTTFTVAPSYLPDAPFISRTYGESSYGTFVAGGKIRFTGPNNPFGVAVIPFYRFFYDKANDARGFNQLQRGASPGGNFGDIGVIGVVDGRLARSVNLSVNVGYILNSSVRSNAFGGSKVTLLDRPDELLTGIGFDFPINKHFQPIAELRATQYVGGRTPNALENSPVEGLLGIRVFPRRFFGFSAAYRRHLNQQDARRFGNVTTTNRFNNLTNIGVPNGAVGPGSVGGAFTNAATTFTSSGLPAGFIPSDDANGFLGQFFIGHRNARAPSVLPNQPPVVNSFTANPSSVVVCPRDPSQATPANSQVQLTTSASDPDGDTLLYTYSVTGGRIVGEGPNVNWDLSGVQPGTYTSTVEVDDGCGCVAFSSTTVNVTECPAAPIVAPPCPTITVSCPTELTTVGSPITFTANVSGDTGGATPAYNWTVSAGTITGGQGTPSITVDTANQGGQSITATVNVGGLAASCPASASCTSQVVGNPPGPTKFDEYGNVNFNDEKARLDNYAIQLQNAPGTQAYIIAYGGRRGRTGEAQARADRAKNYLVNTRGIDAGRIQTVDGGFREDLAVELWLVPQGATPPTAAPTVQPGDVQTTTGPARRGTRRSRRRR
ncbi:MAG: hypothetical protein ACR2LC_02265 [Pyrinomonadaceae bacterium]